MRPRDLNKGSDQARGDRDQRAYCMIRTSSPTPWLEGWHAMEHHSWRWTEHVFAVTAGVWGRFPTCPEVRADTGQVGNLPHALRFRFTSLGPVRIQATVDGEHVYMQPIRPDLGSVLPGLFAGWPKIGQN